MILIIPIILGVVEGIISVALTILTIKSYIKTRIKITLIMVLLNFTIAINGFLFAFTISIPEIYELLAYWCYIILIIFAVSSILFVLLFFEYIEMGMIRTNLTFIFGSLIGALIATLFVPGQINLFYSSVFDSWLINLSDYVRIIIGILGIFTILRLIKAFYIINKTESSNNIKFQFKLFFLGIIFGIIGLFFSSLSGIILTDVNFFLGTIIRGLYPLFLSLGLLIVFIAYFLNPYSALLITQKVYQIIVFNQDGVTLFESRQFYPSKSKKATLITGAIYGLSSMIRHALGIESRPGSLKYEDRTLIFVYRENTQGQNIGFTLISNRDSQILRNGLNNFANLFMQKFQNKLENWNGSIASFHGANKFIRKSFPFLNV
ncbi:MAG: hypothetical protein GF329_19545 [Candidatus Lokiarchaeota archaeon]|nr:hypothetical protein [Candidatus Lokiarchaeota archaeon]